MTKPATLHQADIARAIRAAKDAGLKMVEIAMPGGTVIRLPLTADAEIPRGLPESNTIKQYYEGAGNSNPIDFNEASQDPPAP